MQVPGKIKGISGVLIFFGVVSFLGGFGALAVPVPSIGLGQLITRYQMGVGFSMVIFGGVQIAIGWGLWNVINWARWGAVGLTGLNTLSYLLSGIGMLMGTNVLGVRISYPGPGMALLVLAGLWGWALWILFQPDVVNLFEGGGSAGPTQMPPPSPMVAPLPPTVQAPPPQPMAVPPAPPPASAPTPMPQQPPAPPRHDPTAVMNQPPPASAWLVSRQGGKSHPINSASITIGRDPNRAQVLLDGDTISGEHARIRQDGGQYYLHDLASTNGTFVNNHRVQRHLLRDDDIVRFGNIEMVFKRT